MDKIKKVLLSIASWVYVFALAMVVMYGVVRSGNEYPIVFDVVTVYGWLVIVILIWGAIITAMDKKKEMTLERIANGVNPVRLAWWNMVEPRNGYLQSVKNILPVTVLGGQNGNTIVIGLMDILDDILVLVKDVARFIVWLAVSVLLVTGIWMFVQLYKIPRMARATVSYKANMEKVIRKQWPLYAAQQKYAKADKAGRERIRHAFGLMYKIKADDPILLSMEAKVLKGRS